jgi:phosphoribosylamine--glycine ligase
VRVLGIGDSNDLGAMYLALAAEGHACRVAIRDHDAADTLAGLVTTTPDWRRELGWIRDAGDDGVIVFETAHDGGLQESLRAEGYRVVGGSALGDRLEDDRAFGQEALARAGLQVAPVHPFADFAEAIAFVRATRRRYVFKLVGGGYASSRNYVGTLPDGADMIAFLAHQARVASSHPLEFILMDHLAGVEVGVGANFDGARFLAPVCLDWEHKRFFPGDVGELTGEMGTLVTYRGGERLFEASLARLAPTLAAGGYVGYVNLNTIVDRAGVWPLELTCRFGYPGFAILSALHREGWGDVLRRIVRRDHATPIATHDGYAVGVILTVPPFPYADGYAELSKGVPISFASDHSDEDRRHLHPSEVAATDGGQLVAAGMIGYLMVVTGRGPSAEAARTDAYRRVAKVAVPNLRYRTDIAARFLAEDRATLIQLGWLDGADA